MQRRCCRLRRLTLRGVRRRGQVGPREFHHRRRNRYASDARRRRRAGLDRRALRVGHRADVHGVQRGGGARDGAERHAAGRNAGRHGHRGHAVLLDRHRPVPRGLVLGAEGGGHSEAEQQRYNEEPIQYVQASVSR
jgi:hypothetical protein